MSSAGRTVPWSLSDARTTFLTTTLGVGLLVWAWWESSGTGKLNQQTTWTVVGVLAVVAIGIGIFFWVLSGRRAVRVRRDELVRRIEMAELGLVPPMSGVSAGASSFVVVAGSSRYHRQNCLLVRGKDVHRVPTRARSLASLRPCEMCEP